MHFRKTLRAIAATLAVLSMSALAGEYPNKPIKLVAPFSPGSTGDLVARLLSERMAAVFKQPVIVENKAGAGGNLGAAAVARSAPDGYTLLVTTSSPLVINPLIYRKMPFDVEADLLPVGVVAHVPVILVSNPSFPARNLAAVIAHVRANPGRLSYASSGTGSYAHITMERFKQALGLHLTHVPYKGPAAAETDVVAGQVELFFDGIATANPLIKSGRLRPYAITARTRSPFAPDIPTFAEQGWPELQDFDVSSWVSVLVPAGTPAAIVTRWNRELNGLLNDKDFQDKLKASSLAVLSPSTPAEISARIKAETARWGKVVRDARIEADN
jgi:tripartite-type tricarboxylate transporter receptor subunit TctC